MNQNMQLTVMFGGLHRGYCTTSQGALYSSFWSGPLWGVQYTLKFKSRVYNFLMNVDRTLYRGYIEFTIKVFYQHSLKNCEPWWGDQHSLNFFWLLNHVQGGLETTIQVSPCGFPCRVNTSFPCRVNHPFTFSVSSQHIQVESNFKINGHKP